MPKLTRQENGSLQRREAAANKQFSTQINSPGFPKVFEGHFNPFLCNVTYKVSELKIEFSHSLVQRGFIIRDDNGNKNMHLLIFEKVGFQFLHILRKL